MATVPGTPDPPDPIQRDLRPTPGDIYAAAAHLYGKGAFQVAGDVVPFQRKLVDPVGSQADLDEMKKMMTRDTLSRALGGTSNVTPLKPEDK